MDSFFKHLSAFIVQAKNGELKTSPYPKEWSELKTKVSFGMGAPARVPWIAFVARDMQVSNGFYPVYLYFKDLDILILAYGVSETYEYTKSWPPEILSSAQTINGYLDKDVPRYGDSFVFKAYKVRVENEIVNFKYFENGEGINQKDIDADLSTILDYYRKIIFGPSVITPEISQGRFYMEKQLEDFVISNWEHTDLGKKYNLIVEEGVQISQQYRTSIGPIDILAQEKKTKDYVVIELKKYQTSDDTIGQLARYMGWVQENMGGRIKGVIIAGEYDKKLDFALKVIPDVEVFLYTVDFKLNKFSR